MNLNSPSSNSVNPSHNMPLPIAQLGYMPNINAPAQRQRQVVQDPWAALAAQVLAAAATNATWNLMSHDFASQATAENPEQIRAGAPISPETGQPVSSAAPTPLGPQNAPWYSRMLQGPQMGEKQYAQVQAQRSQEKLQGQQQAFTQNENVMNRNSDLERAAMAHGSAETIAGGQRTADREQLAQKYAQDFSSNALRRDELAAHQEGSAPQVMSAKADMMRAEAASGPNAAADRAATAVFSEYMKYLMEYAKQATLAETLKQQPPRLMTQEEFIRQYNEMRPSFGLPVYGGAPASSMPITVPGLNPPAR